MSSSIYHCKLRWHWGGGRQDVHHLVLVGSRLRGSRRNGTSTDREPATYIFGRCDQGPSPSHLSLVRRANLQIKCPICGCFRQHELSRNERGLSQTLLHKSKRFHKSGCAPTTWLPFATTPQRQLFTTIWNLSLPLIQPDRSVAATVVGAFRMSVNSSRERTIFLLDTTPQGTNTEL